MHGIILFLFLFLGFSSAAQYIMPYEDYRNYFYIYHDGIKLQLESQKVGQYKFSADQLVYIDNANEMVTFYNGEKNKVSEGLNALIGATGNLIYYTRDNALTVIDKGKRIPLSYFLSEFKAGDNIIAFKDSRMDILKVYYNGTVHELEYTLVSKLGNFETGDNTVAYINGSGYFKVFYDGESYEMSNWEPSAFACGKGQVAYVDGSSGEFKMFSKDRIVKLENFAPLSMQMGDDVLAYVSDENAFKIYSGGKLLKIESYAPDFYQVKDNIVAFFASNRFQVMHNGTRYELEPVRPRNFIISHNSLAYVDNAGRLKLFDNGKTTTVTTETVEGFELNGNVVKYLVSGDTEKIYHEGKTY